MKIIKFMINVDIEAKNVNSVINRFEKFDVKGYDSYQPQGTLSLGL